MRPARVSDPSPAPGAAAVEQVVGLSERDVDELGRILPELSSAPPPDRAAWLTIAAAPGTSMLVARLDGRIVGMLTLVVFSIPTGVRALIEDVVVTASARGKGVGSMLVREALALAAAQGARTVDLTSRPARADANRLYERSGFERRETNVWRKTLDGPARPLR